MSGLWWGDVAHGWVRRQLRRQRWALSEGALKTKWVDRLVSGCVVTACPRPSADEAEADRAH